MCGNNVFIVYLYLLRVYENVLETNHCETSVEIPKDQCKGDKKLHLDQMYEV